MHKKLPSPKYILTIIFLIVPFESTVAQPETTPTFILENSDTEIVRDALSALIPGADSLTVVHAVGMKGANQEMLTWVCGTVEGAYPQTIDTRALPFIGTFIEGPNTEKVFMPVKVADQSKESHEFVLAICANTLLGLTLPND